VDHSAFSVQLYDKVTLPDGSYYQLQFEGTPGHPGNVTGRVSSIRLPTGGTISYTYGGTNAISCTDGFPLSLTRTTPDGTWTYQRILGTNGASATIVTAPKLSYDSVSNQTVIQFQSGLETQRNTYQGAAPTISSLPISESTLQTSNLLQEIRTCYNGSASPCTTLSITKPFSQRQIQKVLPNGKFSEHDDFFNANALVTESDDYDYGSAGSRGSLIKKTAITYATLTGITGFPQQVTITNGSGTIVSQTTYTYGDTVTATTGTPQHTTPSGSRGNLLSVKNYTQGSTFLTKSNTYYDTGNVNVTTDVNGAQTAYSYGSGSCGNSFPTLISEPLSLSRTITYNCTGAVQASVLDENGQTSLTAYATDPYFWRPNSATDQSGAQTTFTYTGQTQVESTLPVVSGTSAKDVVSIRDSRGRPSLSQVRQTPGGSMFDTTETDYDAVGRPYKTTLPFGAALGQTNATAPGLITTYDALGRSVSTTDSGNGTVTNAFSQNDALVVRGPAPTGENSKQHQSEYDGLGRLASVCEITSSSGSGICGQTNSKTGFWTKYGYDALGDLTGVTQNAQTTGSTQSRSFAYDLLGRMTSETEAESGTTTYTYDTDATCGTSNGDLVKRVDAVGNVICLGYDALHRNTSITYPSGSYAAKTTNKYFVYDSATVNSVLMTNAKGRLAEAYTAATQGGTKTTDIGYSYTVRGEPSDIYESTPHSAGYYHLAEQFWPNGGAKQLNGLSTMPTFTFNPDGEGRTYQVSASSGQNPVTNTVYNNASLPTSLTFGSADTDAFTYDPSTNRMTQYKFNVNAQSLTGVLTWNANGTLKILNITDGLNSLDTQSCSYGYDDLMRLQSANCGSVWSQTFSYDPFGNIAKSGSASFAAGYSSSTNRITSVGGFTPTYDANGNTLTDPAHTYSWDSAGKPVSIDSVSLTYDALGRMVEQNRAGVYTQFVYGPHGGKFAIMNGQTLQKAIVPLVGGAQAVYNASGLLYYGHSDHLGSIRLGSTPSRTMYFDMAYAPFGETYALSGSTDPAFTGQRQDTVAGVFDFPNREYSNEGRWSSADPSGKAAFHLTDPQSLNRYAYVRNTPLNLVDPTGLCGEDSTSMVPIDDGLFGPDCPIDDNHVEVIVNKVPYADWVANNTVIVTPDGSPTAETTDIWGGDSLASEMAGNAQIAATYNSAMDWVTAGASVTAGAWGLIVGGPAIYSGVEGLAIATEAASPGIFAMFEDALNVSTPLPSVGTTAAGLFINAASIATDLVDAAPEFKQNYLDPAWDWFQGDEVNIPYRPDQP
jgi:RHS repeat-associated protein